MKAARPRSEGEVSRGNTGIDSNLGEGREVTLEPHPTADQLGVEAIVLFARPLA